MTIGCVRCGASQEGDVILPSIAFSFKHDPGCGHGIGPLCVIKGSTPKKVKKKKEVKTEPEPWTTNDTESSTTTEPISTEPVVGPITESEGSS